MRTTCEILRLSFQLSQVYRGRSFSLANEEPGESKSARKSLKIKKRIARLKGCLFFSIRVERMAFHSENYDACSPLDVWLMVV